MMQRNTLGFFCTVHICMAYVYDCMTCSVRRFDCVVPAHLCYTDAIGNDDSYGQEMAMFLNKDDVIKPSRRSAGIRSYCSATVAKPPVDEVLQGLHCCYIASHYLYVTMRHNGWC